MYSGPMRHESGEILEHDQLSEDVYRVRIGSQHMYGDASPGQFVMLEVSPGLDPLLRRPFSLHEVDSDSFQILYRVVGRGTQVLSGRRTGELLDTIGPLGSGFDLLEGNVLLVAGGMGIAPLLFLARLLKQGGQEPVLLYGARTASSLVAREGFEKLAVPVKLATEDGSAGFKGTCTELLESELPGSGYTGIYACGPAPMLAAVKDISERLGISSCQVSVEERMACGVGACLGCSVGSSKGGYVTVCKDGPVFDIGDIAI